MDKKIILIIGAVLILCLCVVSCSVLGFFVYRNNEDSNQGDISKIVDDAEKEIEDLFEENSNLDKTYSNDYYSIDYSSEWTMEETAADEVSFYVYNQDNIPSFAEINELMTVFLGERGTSNITESWCRDYYNDTIDTWDEDYPEDQIEGESYDVETINGIRSCHCIISSKIDGYDATEHLYSFSDGEDVYTIQTYTSSNSSNLDTMLDAVRTFEFN